MVGVGRLACATRLMAGAATIKSMRTAGAGAGQHWVAIAIPSESSAERRQRRLDTHIGASEAVGRARARGVSALDGAYFDPFSKALSIRTRGAKTCGHGQTFAILLATGSNL